MITEATVRHVRFYPEKIPDNWYGDVPLAAEVATPVLDLRRFKPLILSLADISVDRQANVEMRLRADTRQITVNTGALLDELPGAWDMKVLDYARLNFYGIAAVPDYFAHFGMWAWLPTVADKLFLNLPLTPEEKALNEKLGISDTVEKGLLPLPRSQQIEREYRILSEETYTRVINVTVAGVTLGDYHPLSADEFLILTGISAEPKLDTDIVRITIDRDDDAGYQTLYTFPLNLNTPLSCFIPALSEIRLTASAAVPTVAQNFRWSIQRIKMSNLLRVRFGLVTKDELPEPSLWDKVRGGIV